MINDFWKFMEDFVLFFGKMCFVGIVLGWVVCDFVVEISGFSCF